MQSGAGYVLTSPTEETTQMGRFQKPGAALNCTENDVLGCVRKPHLASLKSTATRLKFTCKAAPFSPLTSSTNTPTGPPVPDNNTTVVDNIDAVRKSGSFTRVPVIIGTNDKEVTSLHILGSVNTAAAFAEEEDVVGQLMTNVMFHCLGGHQARLSALAGMRKAISPISPNLCHDANLRGIHSDMALLLQRFLA